LHHYSIDTKIFNQLEYFKEKVVKKMKWWEWGLTVVTGGGYASLESISKTLETLEDKGLAIAYIVRKCDIKLARSTFNGLQDRKPIDWYRYIPGWVDKEDIFQGGS